MKDAIFACCNEEDAQKLDAKSATTKFQKLWYDPISDSSLLECKPITGRTHQIRVHLADLGHPILNDIGYGGKFIGNEIINRNFKGLNQESIRQRDVLEGEVFEVIGKKVKLNKQEDEQKNEKDQEELNLQNQQQEIVDQDKLNIDQKEKVEQQIQQGQQQQLGEQEKEKEQQQVQQKEQQQQDQQQEKEQQDQQQEKEQQQEQQQQQQQEQQQEQKQQQQQQNEKNIKTKLHQQQFGNSELLNDCIAGKEEWDYHKHPLEIYLHSWKYLFNGQEFISKEPYWYFK